MHFISAYYSNKHVLPSLGSWSQHAWSSVQKIHDSEEIKDGQFSLSKLQPYGATGGRDTPILNLCARWKCVISFMPRPPYPFRNCLDTNWTEGWVGLKAGTDVWEYKREFLYSWGRIETRIRGLQTYSLAVMQNVESGLANKRINVLATDFFFFKFSTSCI